MIEADNHIIFIGWFVSWESQPSGTLGASPGLCRIALPYIQVLFATLLAWWWIFIFELKHVLINFTAYENSDRLVLSVFLRYAVLCVCVRARTRAQIYAIFAWN
jgi:hypothetical protein